MSFLSDYIYYSSGNETPEEYLHWGGLSILGHLLGHKTAITHGNYFRFSPNLFVCLVGEAGSGKNTALGVNMDIMAEHFPSWLMSASIQSREDITWQMSDDVACMKTFKTKDGRISDYRPFYILNNELASFLSVDKMKMVEFLTEIYDGKRFGTGFKKDRAENPDRKQWFDRPHMSLIAGAVPEWFMNSLRMDLFSGGLGRRMIIVNAVRTKIIPFPTKPPGADAAMGRVVEHLKKAEKFEGEVCFSDSAKRWWQEWYTKHKKVRAQDPIIYQFDQTKHMQVLKIALLLKMSEALDKAPVEAEHLEASVMMFDNLIPAIVRLTSGIGRNELAGVGSQILDFLNRTGGVAPEVEIKKFFHRYLKGMELEELVKHYMETEQLVIAEQLKDGVSRRFYFTKQAYTEYEARRRAQTAK